VVTGQTWSGFAKPAVVVYFGLLLDKSKVGVAESEKLVAAIFVLSVWPLEPPWHSFLRYSGLHCRRIVHRRLEMLSIRTPGAQSLNLGLEVQFRNRKYFQKCPKWSEMPWNLFLSEKCVRKVVVVVVYLACFWSNRNSGSLSQKNGCTKSKSVAREYNSENGSTFQSAQNGPKSREIDRNSKNVVVKPEVDLQNRK